MELKKCTKCKSYYPGYQNYDNCVFCRLEQDPMLKHCEECGKIVNQFIHSHPELSTGLSTGAVNKFKNENVLINRLSTGSTTTVFKSLRS